MTEISYRRHRFPSAVIQHAVRLYLRFTLSYRDVKELLAERGLRDRPVLGAEIRTGDCTTATQHCPRPSNRWHLDEIVARTAGERMYLWRAVDHEGEVLDMLIRR